MQEELRTPAGVTVSELLRAADDAQEFEITNPEKVDFFIVGEGHYVVRVVDREGQRESVEIKVR